MWCQGTEGVILDLRQKQPGKERAKQETGFENGAETLALCKNRFSSNNPEGISLNYIQKLPLNCPDCGKSFSHSSSLKRHSRTHTGVRPFVCSICSKGFHYKNNLQDHARTHTGEKPFKCPDCGQSFAQSSTLNRHIGTHGKDRKCKVCGKAFVKMKMLQKHLASHQAKEKPEDSCDEKTLEMGKLMQEENVQTQRRTNLEEKELKCLQDLNCVKCGMKFSKAGDLQQHLWTHVGEEQTLFYELAALNGLLNVLELMKQGGVKPPNT